MEKGGQSAMEYLMTYGWAILIILIAIGALFYLGVFSPSTPNNCQIQAPFVCKDVVVNDNGILFNIGSGVNVNSAEVTDVKINGESCSELNGFLYNTEIDGESYTGCAADLSDTNKISSEIELSYSGSGGLSHNIGGDASGSLEEGSIFNIIQEQGVFHLDEENLVFGWDGENVVDYVGGLEGTQYGGVNFNDDNCVLGSCAVFDGEDDYIRFSNGFTSGTNSFTVSAWARTEGSAEYYPLFDFGTTPSHGVALHGTLNRLQGGDGAGNSFDDSNFGSNLRDGIWHHIIVTYDGSTFKKYEDGSYADYYDWSYGVGTPSSFDIGDFWGTSFNGAIDELHIWNRALSPEEVENLYNSYI